MRYAIGEIILVVVGILIALSINNWNETRKERLKEKEVLGALMVNLQRNSDLLNDILTKIDQWNRSTEIVKSTLENQLPYSDTLAIHFFNVRLNGAFQFILNNDGYKFYENAGFDIVKNKTLRSKILALFEVSYSQLKNRIDFLKSPWGVNPEIVYSNFYDLGNGLVPINYNELLANKTYFTVIINFQIGRNWFQTGAKESLVETQNVIQLISDELIKDGE